MKYLHDEYFDEDYPVENRIAKAFRNAARFLKTYWALKRNADPEKVAKALGRPESLELTQEQAEYVQELFLRGAE